MDWDNMITWKPAVSSHTYWNKKPYFLLRKDIYPTWAVFAVEDGSFRYEINRNAGTASFGDLVFCPPGTEFGRETVTPVSFHFILFSWEDTGSSDPVMPAFKVSLNDTKRLNANYAYLRQYSHRHDATAFQWKSHLLTDIWQLFCIENKEHRPAAELSTDDALMSEAIRLIETNAFESINFKQIAKSFYLSPVQFTRRFQAAFRTTPSQYLKSIRLQKAKSLLAETDLTIDQIAVRCGYESGFYLSRVFSETIKMSPSQYRRTHRV
ncbi:helix-turn-helix domain-containing protein [Paenibacillus alkalitolerans]|uniref:helix-turn-helix domain-containing protein n=1 Tax=Paenibacillus alkalitolerans TaxID=2799335 RepID=UPI0018F3BBE1|nr:AraC family transcriptional regulator [Paenibacillus alkalitolerans]